MPGIDARVLARRQKDLDGFTVKYQQEILQRVKDFGGRMRPFWRRALIQIDGELRSLYKDLPGATTEFQFSPINYSLTRLQALKAQVAKALLEVEEVTRSDLSNSTTYEYARSYLYNAWGLEQAAKISVNVPQLSYSQAMGVISNPWLPDGKTYSGRLRTNTAYLAQKMYTSIEEGLKVGRGVNETALRIQETAGEGYNNAVRLARTEYTRAAGQGASFLYMQNADVLDGKRWNAVLDKRTAPKDASNDGKLFELDYDTPSNPGTAGARIPNHPNCRCLWSPVISALGVSEKERVARGEGDSTTNFGERIYTKSRTYREYAKERGLPDLDDRLANDDPRRYLRPGEN